jgi:CelD/BcsL family acetyltransferase involved in cellulose biosynthesis
MTTAAAIQSQTAVAPTWSKTSQIASVEFFDDLSRAEAIWRGLETEPHFSTAYQRFDFLNHWQREVGGRQGFSPFIVVAFDPDRRPLLLLPLALRHEHGVRIASFMGGKHANFNMPLWQSDFSTEVTAFDLDTLISAIRNRSAVDVVAMTQQPQTWRDLPNPMAMLPHQPSANDCPLMTMVPETLPAARISQSFRRRLKSKESKLKALTGYRYRVAADDAEINRLLDAFFRIKPQRMAEQKLPNVFAEPGVEKFIRSTCLSTLPNGDRAIQIHALECDDETIAIFAGVADGHRFSTMFSTYTMSGNSRFSPGLILIRNIVDHYAERGYRAFDLGIGSDGYKKLFCKENEPIFDCFIPLSLRGAVAAAAMSGITRTKRLIKNTPALFQMAQGLRSVLR